MRGKVRVARVAGAGYGVLWPFSGTRFFGSSSRIWNAPLAISKKAVNHAYSVAILWSLTDIVRVIEDWESARL